MLALAKCCLREKRKRAGFTLIELSIVLVIIGLIVGGVLVGRDLISAAAVRAQISQIEKYQQAVNAFRGKYGYLPGDIKDPDAGNFGLAPRGNIAGKGDGNGIIEGFATGQNLGAAQGTGETTMFWRDLSDSNLIDAKFSLASSTAAPAFIISRNGATVSRKISSYLPQARIGGENYIHVWSGGQWGVLGVGSPDAVNYFGISVPGAAASIASGFYYSDQGLTVNQAYAIDNKIDDGLPQSGTVQAWYVDYGKTPSLIAWATGTGGMGDYDGDTGGAISIQTVNPQMDDYSDLSLLCYTNGASSTATERYNLAYPNKVNCALSVKMK